MVLSLILFAFGVVAGVVGTLFYMQVKTDDISLLKK